MAKPEQLSQEQLDALFASLNPEQMRAAELAISVKRKEMKKTEESKKDKLLADAVALAELTCSGFLEGGFREFAVSLADGELDVRVTTAGGMKLSKKAMKPPAQKKK